MAVLLIAAHGTRSVPGLDTTARLVAAVRAARPDLRVELAFLDVLAPSLADALDALHGEDVVVVPLLLSAGYHVVTDIPRVVTGRPSVRVAAHLGPDPLVIEAVADRLAPGGHRAGSILLAAIASSRDTARTEVATAARLLAQRLGRHVAVLPLDGDVRGDLERPAGPIGVATYLLAEGGFFDKLCAAAEGVATVAEPIGVHPALVRLVLQRYEAARTAD